MLGRQRTQQIWYGRTPPPRAPKHTPVCFAKQTSTDIAQSSEARLYTFSQETKDHLRKFRLGTSRASDPQAVICMYALPAPKIREEPNIGG